MHGVNLCKEVIRSATPRLQPLCLLQQPGRRRQVARGRSLAASARLSSSPLHLHCDTNWRGRGAQQNDSPADGYRCHISGKWRSAARISRHCAAGQHQRMLLGGGVQQYPAAAEQRGRSARLHPAAGLQPK